MMADFWRVEEVEEEEDWRKGGREEEKEGNRHQYFKCPG